MKSWKIYLSLVLALVMCLSLSACGGGGSGGNNNAGVTPTKIEAMFKEEYDNTDYTSYLGIWDGVVNEGEDEQKLIVELNEDGEPRWDLYVGGELTYSGFLQIRPQYESYVYACNEYDGCGYICWFDSYNALHIEFDLNGNSCVFVPEGTVPGWVADTEADRSITEVDTSDLAGIYMPEKSNSEWDYLDLHDDSTWVLYGQNIDISGWLGYDEEDGAIYAYEDSDGSGCLFYVDDSDGRLYFASFGYFYNSGMDNMWYEDGGGDHDGDQPENSYRLTEDDDPHYSWNSELYQRNVSEFGGIWYYDGDLAAETYIVIDRYGNWSYYQRAPGAEAAEMDCGTFSYSTNEASVYYADSTMYDGVSYRVFEFDDDVLIWGDEGAYYLLE